jgi:hypothetical protein
MELSVGPVIAGLLGLDAPTISLVVPDGAVATLRDLVVDLDSRAPGALLEPGSGRLHRYIHARINGRAVSDLAHPVGVDDRLRLSLRMIESG